MAIVEFEKYQGTGNDFIVIDNRFGLVSDKENFARKWCNRHFGVGSDGVIFLEKSDAAHFKMDFLNPDGSRSFCGNGSRCAVQFVATSVGRSGACTFEAIDGVHHAWADGDQITVEMKETKLPISTEHGWQLHTGSPHLVIEVSELDSIDVQREGALKRYLPDFTPGGTNVNFVQLTDAGLKMRTYERGVEDETLSCGTGVTAAALCAAQFRGLPSPVPVETRGGRLQVFFERNNAGFTQIKLSGPAIKVFSGRLEI